MIMDRSFVAFVVDREMTMAEKAAVFFKMCARQGLAPGMFGIERRSPPDDVVAIERAVTLSNRHRGLSRVPPARRAGQASRHYGLW